MKINRTFECSVLCLYVLFVFVQCHVPNVAPCLWIVSFWLTPSLTFIYIDVHFSCRWQWLALSRYMWFRCCVWTILSKCVLV